MTDSLKNAVTVVLEQRGCTTREAQYALKTLITGLPVTKANVRECADDAMHMVELIRDRGRLGTIAYEGNAYFWAYKYRFWMRGDAHGNGYKGISIEKARRLIHQKFIENNLELGGEDERHDEIINQVFARGGNKSPNYTQEAA